jgi:hypothetical protein
MHCGKAAMSKPHLKIRYEKLLAEPSDSVSPKDALVALGECIVMDAYEASEQPPFLAAEVALEGARAVIADVSAATASAENLEKAWDRVTTQSECDELTSELVRVRMEAWYAMEAIDSLADAATGESRSGLLQSAAEIDESTRAFDKALLNHLDILSTLVETPWLRKWRQELPPRHEPLPWWMDGTLEAEAIRIGRESDREPRLALPRGSAYAVITASDALPIRRHRDDVLRHAVTALAAAASAGTPMQTIVWTLPGSSLTATLYVPARMTEEDQLSMHLSDGGDGSASHAVGTIVFLNGRAACWRLSRDVTGDFITASWAWDDFHDLSQSRELILQDGQSGVEWIRADSHTPA